jgi:hypothetical protein
MSRGEYSLDGGTCPHCGSEDIQKDLVANEWGCRDCGGSNFETPPDVTDLVARGLTPPEAVDWVAVVRKGKSQVAWASKRDRDQSTISQNVSKASAKIEESPDA